MKKKLLALLLTATLAVGALAGCSNNSSSSSGGSQTSSTEEGGDSSSDVDWPKKSIEIVVPFSAGGDTDFNARILAKYLEKELGQAVIVTNITGGGGTIGADEIMNSPADGYRLLFMHVQMFTNKAFGTVDWGYEAFETVDIIGQGTGESLLVRSDFPADTYQEFLEYAKANPGLNYGCTAGGGTHYVAVAMNEDGAGLNIVTIGESSERIVGLKNGTLDCILSGYQAAKDYIESGDFKIIGVALSERHPNYPDIPTLSEQGCSATLNPNYTLYAPKGTDAAIIEKIDKAVENIVMNNEEYAQEILEAYNQAPYYANHEEALAKNADEDAKFMAVADKLRNSL